MSHRRSPTTSATRTATDHIFDRVTLIAFVLTVMVAATVFVDYGPVAALHHIGDVLAAAGTPSGNLDMWQGAMAF